MRKKPEYSGIILKEQIQKPNKAKKKEGREYAREETKSR